MVAHMMLATKAPEFAMTEEEAINESKAICNYLAHTKVKIDPKTEAFVVMCGTILATEAPKIIMYVRRVAAERKQAQNEFTDPSIVPFPNPGYHMPMGG